MTFPFVLLVSVWFFFMHFTSSQLLCDNEVCPTIDGCEPCLDAIVSCESSLLSDVTRSSMQVKQMFECVGNIVYNGLDYGHDCQCALDNLYCCAANSDVNCKNVCNVPFINCVLDVECVDFIDLWTNISFPELIDVAYYHVESLETTTNSSDYTFEDLLYQCMIEKCSNGTTVESDANVNCSSSNNTDGDYNANDIHDVCGTRDDDQFENCLSIHCDNELSLCNDNALCKIDLGEFDTIISDCHISQWKETYCNNNSYDFLYNNNLTDNYNYNIDTNNTIINSNFSDFSNYTTCSDEFESLFDCFIENNCSHCNEIANKQCMVFPCENDPCDCNGISQRESDDFDEHCLICHSNGCDQCQDDYFKKDYNYPCVECNKYLGDACLFCQDFHGCGQCKDGYTRVYDTDCQLWVCQQNIPVNQPAANPVQAPVVSPSSESQCVIQSCETSPCDCVFDSNCKDCQSWGCQQCEDGYFKKSLNHACVSCVEIYQAKCNFGSCADYQGCTSCVDGFSWYWNHECALGDCQ